VEPGGPGIGPLINYGFFRVERLPGNVAYLDLRVFIDTNEGSSDTATAAMNFLAHTDALIIDLRQNRGGFPTMIQLLCSYLFGSEPVLLNTFAFRAGGRHEEWWTLPDVPGTRYGEQKPVYVLTSAETFSAGEEFAYDLQARRRATIVGEVTGGGANPGAMVPLSHGFAAFIPFGRAVNPVTGTNWEGVGVKPDVPVPATEALRTAQVLALRSLLERGGATAQEPPGPLLGEVQRALGELTQAVPEPPTPPTPVPPSPPPPPSVRN
jgi:C-terminal processing protease CtpA/Prc